MMNHVLPLKSSTHVSLNASQSSIPDLKEGWDSTVLPCVHKAASRIWEEQDGHWDIVAGARMRGL